MAEVFKAKSYGVEGFEKLLAIKRILPTMGEDREFIKMFIDEAKIAGQLAHANICQIYELGRIDGSHFIAMEFIWGKDLLQLQNRRRKQKQPLPVDLACYVMAKVCEGLDYAHRKRDPMGTPLEIVHRDCSPQNVLVSYEGEVKVIDFGIAKASSRSARTQAGVLKGKFGYMSPEQVRGLPLDRRSDIFALGTILYELLTGTRLFQGETDFATLEKVRNVSMPQPRTVNPEIPEAVERIIMKALTKDVEDRYQWCSEMLGDLSAYLLSLPTPFTPKSMAAAMREWFAAEFERETEQLEQYKRLGKEFAPAAMRGSRMMAAVAPPVEQDADEPGPDPTMIASEPSFEDMEAMGTELMPGRAQSPAMGVPVVAPLTPVRVVVPSREKERSGERPAARLATPPAIPPRRAAAGEVGISGSPSAPTVSFADRPLESLIGDALEGAPSVTPAPEVAWLDALQVNSTAPSGPALARTITGPQGPRVPSQVLTPGMENLEEIPALLPPTPTGPAPQVMGTAARPAASSLKLGLIAGGALVCLVGGYFVLRSLTSSNDSDAATQTSGTSTAQGELHVVAATCTSSLCELRIDGKRIQGVARELRLPVAVGRHTVEVKGAPGPCIRDLLVTKGRTVTLACDASPAAAATPDVPSEVVPPAGGQPVPVAPAPPAAKPPIAAPPKKQDLGYLIVLSEPSGVRVLIDGVDTGRLTPIPETNPLKVAAGKHRVTLDGQSVMLTYNVTISKDQTETLSKRMW